MQIVDGQPVFAATDLVGFLACPHRFQLERAALAGLVQKPVRHDPAIELIAKRGYEHEQRYLADLRANGRTVVAIQRDGSSSDGLPDPGAELRAAASETIAAMQAGADVIYQATFFDGRWRGHADFLLRVETPSTFGAWSYEVADTKLALGQRDLTVSGTPGARLFLVVEGAHELAELLAARVSARPIPSSGVVRFEGLPPATWSVGVEGRGLLATIDVAEPGTKVQLP